MIPWQTTHCTGHPIPSHAGGLGVHKTTLLKKISSFFASFLFEVCVQLPEIQERLNTKLIMRTCNLGHGGKQKKFLDLHNLVLGFPVSFVQPGSRRTADGFAEQDALRNLFCSIRYIQNTSKNMQSRLHGTVAGGLVPLLPNLLIGSLFEYFIHIVKNTFSLREE